MQNRNNPRRSISRRLHKWLGLPLCFFMFMAAFSGILTNHRDLIMKLNVPRWIMPKEYTYSNWNSGAWRGSLRTSDRQYIYGSSGVWAISDSTYRTSPQPLRSGLGSGADELRAMAMASDRLGRIWMATQYKLFCLSSQDVWEEVALPRRSNARLSDLVVRGDSIVVMSRSHIYISADRGEHWQGRELRRSHQHEDGKLIFQLVWALHSGAYFGTIGRLVIDILGVIIMLLSVTGIYYFLTSRRLKYRGKASYTKEKRLRLSKRLIAHLQLHNKMGHLIYPLLFVCVTGWMLRPPLMLLTVFHRLKPWAISHLSSDNPWEDRLRSLRYDLYRERWIISTTTGFYTLTSLDAVPKKWKAQPPISPMGINAFAQRPSGEWVIGSFSGLFTVDINDRVYGYFDGSPVDSETLQRRSPVGQHDVAGISLGSTTQEDVIALYSSGLVRKNMQRMDMIMPIQCISQPQALQDEPYSLWHWALEVHTGRYYIPIIGSIGTKWFVFVLGLLSVVVLISGYRRMQRRPK